jgi:hypothetical protein
MKVLEMGVGKMLIMEVIRVDAYDRYGHWYWVQDRGCGNYRLEGLIPQVRGVLRYPSYLSLVVVVAYVGRLLCYI